VISVLYVDDEPGMLDILKIQLEKTGRFKVDIVGSAYEALQKIKEREYDAIVSDYQMAGMDGIELLKAIRKEYPRLPFIIFTGKGREKVAIDALNNGADYYLQKGTAVKALLAELQNMIRMAVERTRLQDALLESEVRYREFFATSKDGVFISSSEGRWIDFNDALLELSGYGSREEFFQIPVSDLYSDKEERETFLGLLHREGQAKDYPIKGRKKDGTIVDVLITNIMVKNPDGSPKMFVGTIRDVTDQKHMIRTLKESEEKYRTLADNAPVGILTCDRSGNITYLNHKVIELLGSPGEERTKEINLLSFPLLVRAGFSDSLRHTLETGEPVLTKEAEYTSKWGKTVRYRLHISPLWNHGSVEGAQVILDDVTPERHEMEKTSQDSGITP